MFVVYGLGMGVIISVLTLAVALAKGNIVNRFRQLVPKMNRIAGALLVIAGAYVAYYGYYEVRDASSGTATIRPTRSSIGPAEIQVSGCRIGSPPPTRRRGGRSAPASSSSACGAGAKLPPTRQRRRRRTRRAVVERRWGSGRRGAEHPGRACRWHHLTVESVPLSTTWEGRGHSLLRCSCSTISWLTGAIFIKPGLAPVPLHVVLAGVPHTAERLQSPGRQAKNAASAARYLAVLAASPHGEVRGRIANEASRTVKFGGAEPHVGLGEWERDALVLADRPIEHHPVPPVTARALSRAARPIPSASDGDQHRARG